MQGYFILVGMRTQMNFLFTSKRDFNRHPPSTPDRYQNSLLKLNVKSSNSTRWDTAMKYNKISVVHMQ